MAGHAEPGVSAELTCRTRGETRRDYPRGRRYPWPKYSLIRWSSWANSTGLIFPLLSFVARTMGLGQSGSAVWIEAEHLVLWPVELQDQRTSVLAPAEVWLADLTLRCSTLGNRCR
jgi:hypothetical protein